MGDSDDLQKVFTEIISQVLASQVSESSVAYSTSTITKQYAANSSNCTNYAVTNNKSLYVADTTIFQKQDVYQKTTNEITNELTANVEQIVKGLGLGTKSTSSITQIISSLVVNTLTADQLDINNNTASSNMVTVQECLNTVDSTNYYVGTKTSIIAIYYDSYQETGVVQEVATTISNYLAAITTQKKVGVIATIVEGLIFLFAILCVCFAVVSLIIILVLIRAP